MSSTPQRVLFLCTGNSCRSQMAEGLLRHLGGDRFVALSAGVSPTGWVHPLAMEVMQELGIDVSQQSSRHIGEFLPPGGNPPDLVISVCSAAEQQCPTFPAAVERLHWPFDDPAQATGTDVERMAEFRRVRDEIGSRLAQHFDL